MISWEQTSDRLKYPLFAFGFFSIEIEYWDIIPTPKAIPLWLKKIVIK